MTPSVSVTTSGESVLNLTLIPVTKSGGITLLVNSASRVSQDADPYNFGYNKWRTCSGTNL